MKRLRFLVDRLTGNVQYKAGDVPFHVFSNDEAQRHVDRGVAEEVPMDTVPTSHWPSEDVKAKHLKGENIQPVPPTYPPTTSPTPGTHPAKRRADDTK